MKINFAIVVAIVKKDLIGLWPFVAIVFGVIIMETFVAEIDAITPLGVFAQEWLPWYSFAVCLLLMVAVIHSDPALSLDHDWLIRPIPRVELLLSKLLFLVVAIVMPTLIVRLIVNISTELSFGASIQKAFIMTEPRIFLSFVFIMAISFLTRSVWQSIGVAIALFMIPIGRTITGPLNSIPTPIPDGMLDFGGLRWIFTVPIGVILVLGMLGIYWLHYQRRNFKAARSMLLATGAVVLVLVFPPAYLISWDNVFQIQQLATNDLNSEIEQQIFLEHEYACFPAAIFTSNESSEQIELQRRHSGVQHWNEGQLLRAGEGSVTMATQVSARNLPKDWRLLPLNATGKLSADSVPEEVEFLPSLLSVATQSSSFQNSASHYWLIPNEVKERFASDESTEFSLDMEFALLKPSTFKLATDGVRRELMDLGFCAAEIDSSINRVLVDCFRQGSRPALVSAALVDIESTRVFNTSRPDYSPSWLKRITGAHYELEIEFANLVDSSEIEITAYEQERFLRKALTSEGVVGDSGDLCPIPDQSPASFSQSNWADNSPHSIRYIAVDAGINLEVVEWGDYIDSEIGGDSPATALVLLAGLGATAHSFDDIATLLAQDYRVIGITRRGFGASSKPFYGYDIDRLSEDIVQVLDELEIDSPVLVGHSMGGDELSTLGAKYPNRFKALVYLDAAYDRTIDNPQEREVRQSLAATPLPYPQESLTYEAIKGYAERIGAPGAFPEGEYLASFNLETGTSKNDPRHIEAIMAGVSEPRYSDIKVPALAVYAVPDSSHYYMKPWYSQQDPVILKKLEELYRISSLRKRTQIEKFQSEVEQAQVVELINGDHSMFIGNEREIVDLLNAFIREL